MSGTHDHGDGHHHGHDHGHGHDHSQDHDHGHGADHTHEPPIKHSFLVPAKYPSRSAIRPQPLSELHPSLEKLLAGIIASCSKSYAEPFKGVTTDGNVVPDLFTLGRTGITLQPLLEAARNFLATLTPDERKTVTFDIDAVEWRTWHNAHPYLFRHGLCLHFLSDDKRQAAMGLARATMSAAGYESLRNVMKINEHVREITGRPEEYGEWHYFVSIFGEPSAERPWGWQIDGHHLNINCFVLGDQMVMTPNFLGQEPVFAESGVYKGTQVMKAEEALGYQMMKALAPGQQAAATLTKDIPRRLFTVAPNDNFVLEHRGIGYDEMNRKQRDLLCGLIELYTSRVRPGHAEIEFETACRYLKQTRFAWAGLCDDVSPFYYRVHSPVIVIEFDHQSGIAFQGDEPARHHIHTLVRTPNGNDYGRDLLRQHYLQYDHPAAKPYSGKGSH